MSNLIPKIKADIKAIEDTVTSDMDKIEVYDKLIEAYNLHKDIIALYEDTSMEITEDVTQIKHDLQEATTQNISLKEQVRVLEAWKDGANLEGEQLKAQITEYEKYIDNMKEQREIYAKASDDKAANYQRQIDQYISTLGEIYQLIPSNAK